MQRFAAIVACEWGAAAPDARVLQSELSLCLREPVLVGDLDEVGLMNWSGVCLADRLAW